MSNSEALSTVRWAVGRSRTGIHHIVLLGGPSMREWDLFERVFWTGWITLMVVIGGLLVYALIRWAPR